MPGGPFPAIFSACSEVVELPIPERRWRARKIDAGDDAKAKSVVFGTRARYYGHTRNPGTTGHPALIPE